MPRQHWVRSVLWIWAILVGVWSHFIVLICISQRIYGVEHLLMLICHFYVLSGEESVQVSHLLLDLLCAFSYCCILRVFCIFWITVFYQIFLSKIFSPILWLVFSVLLSVFFTVEVFKFYYRILMDHAFGAESKESSSNSTSSRLSSFLYRILVA